MKKRDFWNEIKQYELLPYRAGVGHEIVAEMVIKPVVSGHSTEAVARLNGAENATARQERLPMARRGHTNFEARR